CHQSLRYIFGPYRPIWKLQLQPGTAAFTQNERSGPFYCPACFTALRRASEQGPLVLARPNRRVRVPGFPISQSMGRFNELKTLGKNPFASSHYASCSVTLTLCSALACRSTEFPCQVSKLMMQGDGKWCRTKSAPNRAG